MMLARALNMAWMWHGKREVRAFAAATRRVRTTQADLLLSLVRANAESPYGERYGFQYIRSVRDFQAQVPLVAYDDLLPWIEAIAAGREQVLTAEPVLMFEPTGGSSGGAKLIPYTATLRRQFQRAVSCWIRDALMQFPAARNGPAYWSVSPAVQRGQTHQASTGRIPIGFDADTDYLSGWQRHIANRVLLPPREVSRLRNLENFRYATLACLLASPTLALISIWSPTFLTALLERLNAWGESICRDLTDGALRLPVPDEESPALRVPWRADRSRARWLTKALDGTVADGEDRGERLAKCWPRLALLSCWTDASARLYLPTLRSWFPQVPIQPKGLLATEGIVSFPFQDDRRALSASPLSWQEASSPVSDHSGAILAIRSHFFEFLPPDADRSCKAQDIRLVDELEVGRPYRVVMTTGGGLYRYDLGDLVESVGRLNEAPRLRFLGRAGSVTDLVGEKLHEQHVQQALNTLCERFAIWLELAIVLPVCGGPPRYRALLAIAPQPGQPSTAEMLAAEMLAAALDTLLCANPQYAYARGLCQLHRVEVFVLDLPPGEAWRRYESHCLQRGQKAGDIKPAVLDGRSDWLSIFGQPALQ